MLTDSVDSRGEYLGPRPGMTLTLQQKWLLRTRLEQCLIIAVTLLGIMCFAFICTIPALKNTIDDNEEEIAKLKKELIDCELPSTTQAPQTSTLPLPTSTPQSPAAFCITESCNETAAAISKLLNKDFKPCSDMYNFVCSKWQLENSIAENHFIWNQHTILKQSILEKVDTILEQDQSEEDSESLKKAKSFYTSCRTGSEESDVETFLSFLTSYGGWPLSEDNITSSWSWWNVTATYSRDLNPASFLLETSIQINLNSPSTYIVQISPAVPTLSSQLHEDFTDELKTFIDTVIKFLNGAGSEEIASKVIAFDKKLAEIIIAAEKPSSYNIVDFNELPDYYQIEWENFFTTIYDSFKPKEAQFAIISQKTIDDIIKLIEDSDAVDTANYLTWRAIEHLSLNGPVEISEAYQKFMSALLGTTSADDEKGRCINFVLQNLGMAVSGPIIEDIIFESDNLDEVETMISDISKTIVENKVEWMDTDSSTNSDSKLKNAVILTGFPDWLLNFGSDINNAAIDDYYGDLVSSNESHLQNALSMQKYWNQRDEAKLNEKPDREEWQRDYSPLSVKGITIRERNSVVIPAGILMPPFYYYNGHRAVNFGGLGVEVAKKLLGNFDSIGHLYNEDGGLDAQFWTSGTIKNFTDRSQCFIDQYNKYEVNSTQVDGAATLDSNIADNGGVDIAYKAYQQSFNDERLPGLEEYTSDQLFFISYAISICGNQNEQGLKIKAQSAMGPPPRVRLQGVIENSVTFAETFKCETIPQDPCVMY